MKAFYYLEYLFYRDFWESNDAKGINIVITNWLNPLYIPSTS